MVKYARYILIYCLMFVPFSVFAELKNGYLLTKLKIEQRLNNLRKYYSNDDSSQYHSKKVRRFLSKLEKQANDVTRLYNQTNELLIQLEEIDPELYDKANSVTNKKGVLTDIYIKLVPKITLKCAENYKIYGYTNLAQFKNDLDTYSSTEFGENSVCIYLLNIVTAIKTLAHELGHAIYQVENLKTYINYFNREYVHGLHDNYGHNLNDPSLFYVQTVETEFNKKYKTYQKNKFQENFVRSEWGHMRNLPQ